MDKKGYYYFLYPVIGYEILNSTVDNGTPEMKATCHRPAIQPKDHQLSV